MSTWVARKWRSLNARPGAATPASFDASSPTLIAEPQTAVTPHIPSPGDSFDHTTISQAFIHSIQGEKAFTRDLDMEKTSTTHSNPNPFALAQPLTRIRFVLVFVGLALVVFLASLDQTIVAPAVPKIASEFQAFGSVAWIGTAYLLTSTAFQPLYGKFSDVFGRQPVMNVAIAIFLLGSLGCALSTSLILLVVFRAISGIGGGGLITMALIIISDIVPVHQRAKYQGFIGAVFAFSAVIGPLLGGFFTDHITWRWCFYINLPIGALTMVILYFCLHLPRPTGSITSKVRRIDYLGCITLVLAVVALLLPTNWGGTTYPWSHPIIISLYCVGFALLALFVLIEARFAVEPITPGHLFRIRNQAVIYISNFFMGCVFFSIIYYFPEFYQIVRGDSATTSGLELLPFVLPVSLVAAVSGIVLMRLGSWGSRFLIAGGMALLTIATGFIRQFGMEHNAGFEIGMMILGGLGCGMEIQTTTIVSQISAPEADMAIATTLQSFFHVVGGVFGIAITGAVLNSGLDANLPPLFARLGIDADPHGSLAYLQTLIPEHKSEVVAVYVAAFQNAFTVYIPFAGIAFIFAMLIKITREHMARLHKVEAAFE